MNNINNMNNMNTVNNTHNSTLDKDKINATIKDMSYMNYDYNDSDCDGYSFHGKRK